MRHMVRQYVTKKKKASFSRRQETQRHVQCHAQHSVLDVPRTHRGKQGEVVDNNVLQFSKKVGVVPHLERQQAIQVLQACNKAMLSTHLHLQLKIQE